MSININHPNDDISTSGGLKPTLGGGAVSAWAMDTATATATYWTKLAEFDTDGSGTARINVKLNINGSAGQATGFHSTNTNISLYIVETVANGFESTVSDISILQTNEEYINHDSFMLVQSVATAGTPIELYMKSNTSGTIYTITEESITNSGVAVTTTYQNGSTWTVTTPTGAVTITSDWAGSGPITSTSLSNSTGTVYYEKSDDGLVTVDFVLTALTTTTDATTYFTMPAGFRHGISGLALDSILSGVITGGAAGVLRMSDVGVVAIYNYAASTGNWRASFRYRARA